jgi:hypothetical protein
MGGREPLPNPVADESTMEVVRDDHAVVVLASPARSLAAAGTLFGLLSIGLILGAPSGASGGSFVLLVVASGLLLWSRRRPVLCRLQRDGATIVCGNARQPGARSVQLRWSSAYEAHLELRLLGDSAPILLLSHPHVGEALETASQLASALDLNLRADGDAMVSPSAAPVGETATVGRSPALIRARRATTWIGGLLALYFAVLVWTHVGDGHDLHPLSVACAIAAPAALLLVALVLTFRAQQFHLHDPLRVTVSLSTFPVLSTSFSDATLTFAALLHPQLRLAYLWLKDDQHSLLLTTDRASVASLSAALTQRGITNITRQTNP